MNTEENLCDHDRGDLGVPPAPPIRHSSQHAAPIMSNVPRDEFDRRFRARRQSLRFAAQLSADVIAITLAILIAGGLAWAIDVALLHIGYQAFSGQDLQRRIVIWAFLSIAVCAWFAINGTYSNRRAFQEDLKLILGTVIAVLVLDGFIEFAVKEHFSRLWIFLVWPTAAVTLPAGRVLLRRALDRSGAWRVGAAVMGTGSHYASVEETLLADYYIGYFVSYFSPVSNDPDRSAAETGAHIRDAMKLRGAEIVLLVPSESEMAALGKIIDALNFSLTPYVLIPPIQRLPFSGLSIQSLVNSDAIMMTSRNGLLSPARQLIKRAFDISVSAILIIVFAPLLIVLTLAIAADGGAPIFGHERIGRDGKPFRCLKFRSMAKHADKLLADLLASDADAAKQWHQNFKLENDPRITRFGNFLRKSSLDELPQLLNVLRGEMSLVGPRPVVSAELTQYYGEDAFYYRLVRPGLTGLWQVSGRSDTTYSRRVFLDAWYVRNWNLWMDLVLLFSTVPTAIRGSGAK
jgi:Undecaprenyl-phosphate galactose phosphotransferase WbaP